MMEDHTEDELEAIRAELEGHSNADDTLLNDSNVDSSDSKFGITENIRPSFVPLHVMGRNLNDPDSDYVGERKPSQKPRLGVKVPYRNLTSQIVTQDEIAQEIADRFSRKYTYTDPKVRDPYFAMKLTHRLANQINQNKGVKDSPGKILLEKKNLPIVDKKIDQESADLIKKNVIADLKKETLSETVEEIFTEISNSLVGGVISDDPILNDSFNSRIIGIKTEQAVENRVSNNEALLAVLEGTSDTEVTEINNESSILEPPKIIKKKSDVKRKRIKIDIDPELEREIALKQLESIPKRKKRKTKMNENDNSVETRSPSNSSNNNSDGTINNNILNSSKNKKVKRNPKKLYESSTVVKKFPKKYQQQNLKKRKSLLDPSMKLPDVPEVQIAIDNYIKTYASKRKLKSSPIVDGDSNDGVVNETIPQSTNSDTTETNSAVQLIDVEQCTIETEILDEQEIQNDEKKMNIPQGILNTTTTPDIEIDISEKDDNDVITSKTTNECTTETGNVDENEEKHEDVSVPEVLPQKKTRAMREVERLLGDEGAVNMIYSVEQRGHGSHNFTGKQKLVKNAVLAGFGSPLSSPLSTNRPRRIVTVKRPFEPSVNGFKKQPPASTPVQKVRKAVAAEASRIISRHSSDSEYSSDEENYLIDDSDSIIDKAVENNSVRLSENWLDVENVVSNEKSNLGENGIELSKHSKERSPDEFAVLRRKNVTQIILSPSSDRMKNYLTIEILNKFTDTLKKLEEWVDCNVVLVTANGKSFCDGIDIKKLICEEENERRSVAVEYLKAINEFIYCLIRCTKLLVAVVDGPVVGLGVGMLSHFDMVYASNMATFCTMYKKFSHIPEAGSILTLPKIIGSSVAHDVLFCDRKLTANEAYKIGWICELLDRRKLKSHIFSIGETFADYSIQSVKATKQLIRKNLNQMLEVELESEEKLLTNQWCSEECQKKFKDYLNLNSIY